MDFENELRNLRLAGPSSHLRDRIFGRSRRKFWPALVARSVSVRWAASIAIIAGFAGMFFARGIASLPVPPDASVHILLIQPASDRNLFDFSRGVNDCVYDSFDLDVVIDEEA